MRLDLPAKLATLAINRNFGLLWTGRAISNVGDFVFDTTLILWIAVRLAHGQTWAPLAVSGVLLATSMPTFALGPLAGVLADRWEKRRTMLLMDALRAILIGLLIPVALAGTAVPVVAQLAVIYAVVFLTQVCSLLFAPSRLALLGDMVPREQLAPASSRLEAVSNLAALVGPPIAPLLFFGLGVEWALLANALSFILSFLTLLAIRVPATPVRQVEGETSVRAELFAGFRFVLTTRLLLTVAVSVMVGNLGWGALSALNIFFLMRNLHVSAALFGLPAAANAIGAIAGAVVAGMVARRLGLVRLFWITKLLLGLLVLAYARLTSFPAALVVFAILGVTSAATEVCIGPMVLQATPRELIGRVSMTLFSAAYVARMGSTALAGVLASTLMRDFPLHLAGTSWGPIDTIFTGAGLLILAGGVSASLLLRGIDVVASPREELTEGGAA